MAIPLRTASIRPAGLLGALLIVALMPSSVGAQVGEWTNDQLCDLTPSDGNWSHGPELVDEDLSLWGMKPHEVSVPDASAGCSNLFQYFDGTWVYVAIYWMPSEQAAQAANTRLRSSAAAAAPVEEFATPLLGDEAWIAHFEFDQLAFTRAGSFLIGGHSVEAYDYSRADYSQLLIDRMGEIVTNVGEQVPVSPGTDTTTGTTVSSSSPTNPTGSTSDDSGGFPGGIVGIGAAVAAAAAAGVALRRGRTGRSGADGGSESSSDEREDDEPRDRSTILELTHPAGLSPNVFQFGWIFGARCIVDAGTPDQRDLSDRVHWSGDAEFHPPVGRLSRPLFRDDSGSLIPMVRGPRLRRITLTVDVDGVVTQKIFPVSVVRTVDFSHVSDLAACASNAHGCPACPHPTVGPILVGSPTVLLDGLPAARVGDRGVNAACCGSNTFTITSGDPAVLIDGRPAARRGSETRHCGGVGRVITGSAGGL